MHYKEKLYREIFQDDRGGWKKHSK